MALSRNDWRFALIGTICTIVLMVIMVVFARLSASAAAMFKVPALALTWFSVLLLMVWATGLTSWAFIGWPDLQFISRGDLDKIRGTSACTVVPSSSTEFLREASAGAVFTELKQVADWGRQTRFRQLYRHKYIPGGGWIDAIEGLPQFEKGICSFMVLEDKTGAHVKVASCRKDCDFRNGDRVRLSGWLMNYDNNQIEIVANKVDEPPRMLPGPAASPRQVFVVCHGEHETKCKAHPYDKFEHCGDDNGVGGADGNVSGRNLCGNENFDVLPAEGGSIGGNHCGYSCFKMACK